MRWVRLGAIWCGKEDGRRLKSAHYRLIRTHLMYLRFSPTNSDISSFWLGTGL